MTLADRLARVIEQSALEMSEQASRQAVQPFILARLMDITKNTLPEAVLLTSALDSTGIDSLELMELLLLIEDQFDVRIEDAGLTSSTTVADLIAYVEAIRTQEAA